MSISRISRSVLPLRFRPSWMIDPPTWNPFTPSKSKSICAQLINQGSLQPNPIRCWGECDAPLARCFHRTTTHRAPDWLSWHFPARLPLAESAIFDANWSRWLRLAGGGYRTRAGIFLLFFSSGGWWRLDTNGGYRAFRRGLFAGEDRHLVLCWFCLLCPLFVVVVVISSAAGAV